MIFLNKNVFLQRKIIDIFNKYKMKRIIINTFFASLLLLSLSNQGQTTRLQAIHNCPDTIVDTVDVYLDNTLLIPGFAFQNATPFIDAPAGLSFDLVLTSFGKGDTINPLFRKTFFLADSITYVIVASGEVGNPGINGFDLRTYTGQETSTNSGFTEVSLKFIHGVYDAPMIDVFEQVVNEAEIFSNISFGQDSGYVDLDATDLGFQIKTQNGQVIGEYDANFIPFEDSAIIVLTTGFLDTTGSAGIEPFGLIAVLANGNVIHLPSKLITPAHIQVIHNCAATDVASVDVWLNAGPQPLIDNFNFRTATPFIDAPAGTFFDISICLPNSTDTSSALYRQSFILESNKTYIIIASGIAGSGSYNPMVPFTLDVIPDARQVADISSNVDVVVWHGSTDAPYVDVAETQIGAGTIVDNISYGTYQGYLGLPPQDYDLTIQDSSGTINLISYDGNLTSFTGQAITILASGFLNPANNNNGPDFGLWVATVAGGNLIPLSVILGIDEFNNETEISLFPNPSQEEIKLSSEFSNSKYSIYNMNGQVVKSGQFENSSSQNINVSNLSKGIYQIQISIGNKQIKKLFSKL